MRRASERDYHSALETDNPELHLIPSVSEDSLDLSVSLVRLALLSMITATVFANHALTNQLIHTTTKQPNSVINAPTNAQRVWRMYQ